MNKNTPKNGSAAEKLAENLINAKKWKRIEDHRPAQSGWYPVVVCVHADKERQWAAVGCYSWPRDRWQYSCGDLAVEGSGSVVTHWLDCQLPPLPPTFRPKEGA